MARPPRVNFVLAGNAGVGKTSLVQRLKNQGADDELHRTEPTIGLEFVTWSQWASPTDSREVRIVVFDLAGDTRFVPITSRYFSMAHAIILMFDLTDRQSFDDLGKRWWDAIERYSNYANDDDDDDDDGGGGSTKPTLILVGNKLDLVTKQGKPRAVTAEEMEQFAAKYRMTGVVECSVTNWSMERYYSPFDAFIQATIARLPPKAWEEAAATTAAAERRRATVALGRRAGTQPKGKGSCCSD